jgi:hypothetical protein
MRLDLSPFRISVTVAFTRSFVTDWPVSNGLPGSIVVFRKGTGCSLICQQPHSLGGLYVLDLIERIHGQAD